jgi:hypothetical protein
VAGDGAGAAGAATWRGGGTTAATLAVTAGPSGGALLSCDTGTSANRDRTGALGTLLTLAPLSGAADATGWLAGGEGARLVDWVAMSGLRPGSGVDGFAALSRARATCSASPLPLDAAEYPPLPFFDLSSTAMTPVPTKASSAAPR